MIDISLQPSLHIEKKNPVRHIFQASAFYIHEILKIGHIVLLCRTDFKVYTNKTFKDHPPLENKMKQKALSWGQLFSWFLIHHKFHQTHYLPVYQQFCSQWARASSFNHFSSFGFPCYLFVIQHRFIKYLLWDSQCTGS